VKRLTLLALLAMATILARAALFAHEEAAQKVMGTVSSVGPGPLDLHVKDVEGRTIVILLNEKTVFLRGAHPVTRKDVTIGTRVVVLFDEEAGVRTAVEVRLPEASRSMMHEHGTSRAESHPRKEMEQMHGMHASPGNESEAAPATLLELAAKGEASGTSWQPETTPHSAFHAMASGWTLMLHGNLFAGYDHQGGERGGREFAGTGWLMGMARHPVGKGELVARVMLSPEPIVLRSSGYPLLLQTGESVDGEPLHDRQHPHDLFMEIAALFRHPLGESLALELYAAPSGEPALGPTAFPHRASAESDPLAPLGHHWQDSTHISYGVVTAGFFSRRMKLEGSWFNGREPDETRTNLDFRRLDSCSGRISWSPSERLSLQASWGFLKSPEEHEPETSLHRLTASVAWTRAIREKGRVAAMAVFGRNDPSEGPSTNSYLLEADAELDGRNTVFGRTELVQKTGKDLVLSPDRAERVYDIGSLVLGYLHDFEAGPVRIGIGGRASIAVLSEDLSSFYGGRAPIGGMVFVRIKPPAMASEGVTGHHH
jgi:hypothetical protein